jgi:hypothetical protein
VHLVVRQFNLKAGELRNEIMNTPRTDEQVEFCKKLGIPKIGEVDFISAPFARTLERTRNQAIERLRDILKGDDGQAYKEAEKFLDLFDRII